MAGRFQSLPLPFAPPGTSRTLTVRRYGRPGARPKACIQAGLHADEVPGMLVAHHLAGLLERAERAGGMLGEVVLVPVANPIGLDQRVLGMNLGRYALDRGTNFNRGFTLPTDLVAERVAGRLGPDAGANVALIRQALLEVLAAQPAPDALSALRRTLLGLALDADIVLDLHCDQESLLHLYTGQSLWPEAADLAGWLGCGVVLLADASGGDPFDEACAAPWWRLAARFGPALPVPPACLAATVELRGQRDVSSELAAGDAGALLKFLQTRGVVAGDPGPPPAPTCPVTPLAGVDRVQAGTAGILHHRVELGALVAAGQPVAEIIDPTAADPASAATLLSSRTAGVLWARSQTRFARPGDIIASIAGQTPLPQRPGGLLVD